MKRRRLKCWLWLPVVGCLVAGEPKGFGAGLELEVNVYLKNLKSESLRKVAEKKAEELKSKDAEKRNHAIAFFHDVRARHILVELLDVEDSQDLVAAKYLGPIEFDCLERLFAITHRSLPKKGVSDPLTREKQAARNTRVKAINAQAAKVLGVDPAVPKEWNRESFKESWLKMLQTAKEKRTLWKPVDETLAKIKEDMKKDKEREKKEAPEEKKK